MSPDLPIRTLSERESRLLSRLAATGHAIFTVADAQGMFDGDSAGLPLVLHRLAVKRWLQRLERGKYRLIPLEAGPEAQWAEHDYLVAAALTHPYYLAYGTALHYYGYSERQPRPVWIATTQRKRPLTVDGTLFRFVTLGAAKFFGYTTIQLLDQPVQIAGREKAIADGFDHPAYCGGVLEPAKGLWFGSDELDLDKLIEVSRRLGNRAGQRRLGYWLERLNLADDAMLARLSLPEERNYALLDPAGLRSGPKDARWRLIVNIPEGQLLEWRGH